MKKRLIILFIGIIFLQGCALNVNLTNPKPNLNLPVTKQTFSLAISDDIENSFTIPAQNGVRKAGVTDWHKSLKNGFKNGFGDYFTISENKNSSDLILELNRAEIEFVPAAISEQYAGVVAINVQITYNATLLDNNGEVIGRTSGTAISKSAINNTGQLSSGAESGIESMYEIIGKEFFEN